MKPAVQDSSVQKSHDDVRVVAVRCDLNERVILIDDDCHTQRARQWKCAQKREGDRDEKGRTVASVPQEVDVRAARSECS